MGTKLALRAGQLAADTEFMTAKYTDVFTNASLGWPAGFSLNMPSGGPSPPLPAMGTRLRADVSDNLTLIVHLVGVRAAEGLFGELERACTIHEGSSVERPRCQHPSDDVAGVRDAVRPNLLPVV